MWIDITYLFHHSRIAWELDEAVHVRSAFRFHRECSKSDYVGIPRTLTFRELMKLHEVKLAELEKSVERNPPKQEKSIPPH